MVREEKAVIYVTSQYLTESPLMPVIEDYDEVHFEVELVHFIQVSNTFHNSTHVLLLNLFVVACTCSNLYYNVMENKLFSAFFFVIYYTEVMRHSLI